MSFLKQIKLLHLNGTLQMPICIIECLHNIFKMVSLLMSRTTFLLCWAFQNYLFGTLQMPICIIECLHNIFKMASLLMSRTTFLLCWAFQNSLLLLSCFVGFSKFSFITFLLCWGFQHSDIKIQWHTNGGREALTSSSLCMSLLQPRFFEGKDTMLVACM